ncbi:MAG: hypothetical protein PVJ05_00140 [Candidatus Thorarchaeota archaeon]|jgi:hypothetical protein
MCFPTELRTVVWVTSTECERGSLKFSKEGVSAKLDSGKVVMDQNDGSIAYTADTEIIPKSIDQCQKIPLQAEVRINLNPQIVVERPYTIEPGPIFEDIFPPSTLGFYNRMTLGTKTSIFTVQEIEGDSRLWLTVSDPHQNVVYEAHKIQPYEVEAIQMFDDDYIDGKLYQRIGGGESAQSIIAHFLDCPPPSWGKLAKLVSDVSIPNLRIEATMRETLSQFVPDSFPEQVREELMAFLAFVVDDKIPDEDPLEYSVKLLPVSMTGSLLMGHLRCMIDNASWPSYVKYMTQAARGQLEAPKRALGDSVRKAPWMLFWQKCLEVFPSWLNEVIRLAKQLNESGKVVMGLPVSKTAAKRSRRKWKQRLAALTYDLRLIGFVKQSAFGLADIVYLGSAYRWPHRHMKFITRLGESRNNVPFLQVLTTPLSVVERIRRVLPGAIQVTWSTRHSNLDLFSDSEKEWQIQENRIIRSIQKKGSLRRLMKRYGPFEGTDTHSMSVEEAKIIDLVAAGIPLDDLENENYADFWRLPGKWKRILTNLVKRELVRIQYDVRDDRLLSIATIAQGPPNQTASLVESFLENTPTSLAMIGDDGRSGIIISRLPESSAYEISSTLPNEAHKQDLQIRCLRPTSYQSYSYNLYQRLLKRDGSWDDDVSAFLSQARSKRKELSESNA